MTGDTSVSLILIFLFLVLSAFFSSSEAAFLSLQKTRLSFLVNSGVPGAKRVADMIGNTDLLLSTILLGNNLVNVAFTAVITALAVAALGRGPLAVAAATITGTILLLVFGEIIPKSLAVRRSEKVAFAYARPLKAVELSLYPIIIVLQWLSNITQSIFTRQELIEDTVTEIEIRSLIDIGEAEGTVEPSEAEMLENVFRFGDRQVREVMTPRTEIVSIKRGSSLRDFLKVYSEHPHTRFPVFKETSDDIINIISVKDVLKALSNDGIKESDSVTDITRDAYFVPETKQTAELFDELRRTGNQMAICLDEYGGLAGLVTTKRLTEVVVGPVGEEGESPEDEYESIYPNVFHIDGSMDIEEANEEMHLDLPIGDYETIAGFVLTQVGEIPSEGDEFTYENLYFKILQMDHLKIVSIMISIRDITTDYSPSGTTVDG